MGGSARMAGLGLGLAVGLVLAGCGLQPGVRETATANADNSLALIESIEPAGPTAPETESLFLEARGGSTGSRLQISGVVKARELHPHWIGRTTLALCLDPPAPLLVSEIKVRPGQGWKDAFATALGGSATIAIIQACADGGAAATAAPPPATGPAATAAPAAAAG